MRLAQFEDIGLSPLVRVAALGLGERQAGIRFELIALEVRTGGALLHWHGFPASPMLYREARFVVRDGTRSLQAMVYEMSGTDTEWRGQTAIAPAPSDGGALVVVIDQLKCAVVDGYSIDDWRAIPGEWRFEFGL
jgi:hypothetical protein